MNCARCGSVMVYEKFYSSHESYWGWRCISCGEILDQIILENRSVFGKRGWLKRGGREARETEKEGSPD